MKKVKPVCPAIPLSLFALLHFSQCISFPILQHQSIRLRRTHFFLRNYYARRQAPRIEPRQAPFIDQVPVRIELSAIDHRSVLVRHPARIPQMVRVQPVEIPVRRPFGQQLAARVDVGSVDPLLPADLHDCLVYRSVS